MRKPQNRKRRSHPNLLFLHTHFVQPLAFRCSWLPATILGSTYWLLKVTKFKDHNSKDAVRDDSHPPHVWYTYNSNSWWCIYSLNYLPLREAPHATQHVTNISSFGASDRRLPHEIMIRRKQVVTRRNRDVLLLPAFSISKVAPYHIISLL